MTFLADAISTTILTVQWPSLKLIRTATYSSKCFLTGGEESAQIKMASLFMGGGMRAVQLTVLQKHQ